MSANCLPVPALICALHSTHNLNLNGHYVISNSNSVSWSSSMVLKGLLSVQQP